jgi:oligopeptide transport system substrate-binding protein
MLRVLAAFLVVPALALLVWQGLAERSPRADFVIAIEEPGTLDPQRVSWLAEISLAAAMFEGLTRVDPRTLRPEPGVASRWEVDASATMYTFHLRPEARWSNGDPVVADDFRFAWLRVLDPRTEAQYASLLFMIAGAEAYYLSRADADAANDIPADGVGVEVLDPHTLRVRLAAPVAYFLELTAFPTFAPVHPPTVRCWAGGEESAAGGRGAWMRPGRIVTNGAFLISAWDFKRRIRLARNPYYWDAANIHLDSIEAAICTDANVQLIAYETGEVDLVRSLPAPLARRLLVEQRAGRRRDFHYGDRFATFFFRVNCRRPPLDNADLRKALSLAIDRAALAEQVMGLGEAPAQTLVPRGALPFMPRTTPDGRAVFYDPPTGLWHGLDLAERVALAHEYLRRSGFDGRRRLELAFAADNREYRRIAEAVQEMWRTQLGLDVDVQAIEGRVLRERIRNLDYDLARSEWFGDYLDPSTFLQMFTTDSGQNRTGWSNVEFDELIAAAAKQAHAERRFELYRRAEQILCEEELPIIPLFFKSGNFLLRPRIEGLRDNPLEILPVHRVRTGRDA